MGLSHADSLVDSDVKCTIDVNTKSISSSSSKNTLVQHDHLSERVGFVMPRYVDGHDMSLTDKVTIHYVNGSASDSYMVDDMSISEDESSIEFTWLISNAATQNVGSLVFGINFKCLDANGNTTYNWSTKPCSIFSIVEGIGENADETSSETEYAINRIQTKLAKLEKDIGSCLTSEADPTVPSWAKEKNKPTYTATEVGADPAGTAERKAAEVAKEIPTKTSQLDNDSGYLTEHQSLEGYVRVEQMNDVIGAAITPLAADINQLQINKVDNSVIASLMEDYYTYGFVEHMGVLAAGSRIEYIGINQDYTAMSMDLTNHSTDYGSWSEFPTLVENKPYMVRSTGEADYQLYETDYSLKADGETPSDIANTEYDGGAFSKFIKIYVKRWVRGTDRYVRFSFVPIDGYTPCGFIDTDNHEMDYVWLPMFYGSTVDGKMRSLSGLQPDKNQNTSNQKTYIDAFSSRAAFYGGPIHETIRDLLYMFFKTTDIQAACGKGNMSGYNGSDANQGVLPNAVIPGGQFYGSSTGKELNKILHSVVIGSYQQWQRDPYVLVVNGRVKVSINYTYDLSGASYIDTGIDELDGNNAWVYPHLSVVIDGYGSFPIGPCNGSTSTGYCDGTYVPANKNFTAVVLRFGNCNVGAHGGPACLILGYDAGAAHWGISASVLLRPPVAA